MQEAPAHPQGVRTPSRQAPYLCSLPQLPAYLTTLTPFSLSPHRVLLAKTEKLELRDLPDLL